MHIVRQADTALTETPSTWSLRASGMKGKGNLHYLMTVSAVEKKQTEKTNWWGRGACSDFNFNQESRERPSSGGGDSCTETGRMAKLRLSGRLGKRTHTEATTTARALSRE